MKIDIDLSVRLVEAIFNGTVFFNRDGIEKIGDAIEPAPLLLFVETSLYEDDRRAIGKARECAMEP